MNETINMGPNPEERKRRDDIMKKAASTLGITVEEVKERLLKILGGKKDIQELADHFAMHPEQLESPKTLREVGPKITELEIMIASFEATHSLEELHAIVDLSPDLSTLFKYADDLASPERIENAIKTYEKHNPGYVEVYKKKIANVKDIVLIPEDAKKFEIRMTAKKDLAPIIATLNTLKNEELKIKCKRLMKAVGSIISDKVNHE